MPTVVSKKDMGAQNMLRSAAWCRFLDAKSDKISMATPLRIRKYAFTVVGHVETDLQEERKQE